MSTPRLPTTRLLSVLLATGVALWGAAACSSDDHQDTPPSSSHSDEDYHGTPGLPDANGPAGILTTALTSMFSWEPVTDASPTDALARTSDHLTGAALRSAQSPARVRASAEWTAWRSAGDLVTARVDSAQITPIDPNKAMGRATVTQTVLHLDGGATPYQRITTTTQLVRTTSGWKLATYPDITTTTTG